MSKEYNGWSNKETWLVKLWLDADPGMEWFQRAQAAGGRKNGKYLLAERLLEGHCELASLKLESASLFSDLVQMALGRVNWMEVAGALIADAK